MPKLHVFMQKGWPCVYRAIISFQCGLDARDCDNVECIAALDEEEEEDI